MTYAIIETGGKQYMVNEGDQVLVEKLDQTEGTLALDRVLLISDGQGKTTVGKPTVPGAVVKASIVAQEKGPKLLNFKFRNKTGYRKTIGHRQQLTRLKIESIQGA